MATKTIDTRWQDVDILWEYFDGAKTTMLLKIATELQIFDHIRDSEGGMATAAVIAEQQGWHEESLERTLNGLAALNLMEKDEHGGFRLTSMGERLARDAPDNVWGFASHMADMGWNMMKTLKSGILHGPKEGGGHHHHRGHGHGHHNLDEGDHHGHHGEHEKKHHGHHHHHHHHDDDHDHGHHHGDVDDDQTHHSGDHGKDHHHHGKVQHGDHHHLEEYISDKGGGRGLSEKEDLELYASMGALMKPYLPTLLNTFDLSHFKSAVDLGGGSGTLSFALCRAYPQMHVTLMDMENTINITKKHFLPKDEKLNVSFIAGDFFEQEIPTADLYVISQVTHHISDYKWLELLKKTFERCNPGGGFLMVEKTLENNKVGPYLANAWDLMLLSDKMKMRSRSEHKEFLEKAGYNEVQFGITSEHCIYDMVYARKPHEVG